MELILSARTQRRDAPHPRQATRRAARRLTAALLVAACALPAAAQQPLQLPRPVGYVNDFANVIPAQDEAAIQAVVDEVRQKSGGEIVVVTLPSLQGRSRDEVALQLGRQWGVGRAGQPGDPARNTGVIILVAPNERELKIELAAGANNFITAAEAGRVRDQYMVPAFRRGDYGTGIRDATTAIAQMFAGQFGFQLTGAVAPPPPQRQPPRGPGPGSPGSFLWIVILVIFLLALSGGGRGGRRGRRGRSGCLPIFLPFPMGGGG
ncbi:MAG TPA: TPM domain-containing protein, partial [Longimicrobiaceae bacterium]|nr:TPM domain-containing protein [Longimicrobiaceae bacterium]